MTDCYDQSSQSSSNRHPFLSADFDARLRVARESRAKILAKRVADRQAADFRKDSGQAPNLYVLKKRLMVSAPNEPASENLHLPQVGSLVGTAAEVAPALTTTRSLLNNRANDCFDLEMTKKAAVGVQAETLPVLNPAALRRRPVQYIAAATVFIASFVIGNEGGLGTPSNLSVDQSVATRSDTVNFQFDLGSMAINPGGQIEPDQPTISISSTEPLVAAANVTPLTSNLVPWALSNRGDRNEVATDNSTDSVMAMDVSQPHTARNSSNAESAIQLEGAEQALPAILVDLKMQSNIKTSSVGLVSIASTDILTSYHTVAQQLVTPNANNLDEICFECSPTELSKKSFAVDADLPKLQRVFDLASDPYLPYFEKAFVANDPNQVAVAYARAAIRGHARSALYLGQLFETGDGVAFAPEVGARWYAVANDASLLEGGPSPDTLLNGGHATPLFSSVQANTAEFIWQGNADLFQLEIGNNVGDTIANFPTLLTAAMVTVPDDARFWRVRTSATTVTDWILIDDRIAD